MINKKLVLLLISIILTSILLIGITYAFWRIVLVQENENILATGCFNVTLTESKAIEIREALPTSDNDGKQLIPYTFTIKNICEIPANYQVNLEILNESTLLANYIKVVLNDRMPKLLTNYKPTEITLAEVKESYKLITGDLMAGESVTYELRIWLDEKTTTEQALNKVFVSKISVVTEVLIVRNLAEHILANNEVKHLNNFNSIAPSQELYYQDYKGYDEWSTPYASYFYSNILIGTDYYYDEYMGTYSLAGTITSGVSMNNPKIGQYTIMTTSFDFDNNMIYKITDFISSSQIKVSSKNGQKYKVYDSFDSGLYSSEDDYGISYYFRGHINHLNVNVIFGGYRWKIVRIDGRGNIKLIYVGKENEYYALEKFPALKNYSFDKSIYFNSHGSIDYFKYMLSPIKTKIDNFYNSLKPSVKAKIVDSIYCNDFDADANYTFDSTIYFTSYARLSILRKPSLKCLSEEGSLILPIGLITADELIMAGLSLDKTADSYLSFKNQWTMTPYFFGYMSEVWGENDSFTRVGINNEKDLYPVITISSEVAFEGNGSETDPYIIKN